MEAPSAIFSSSLLLGSFMKSHYTKCVNERQSFHPLLGKSRYRTSSFQYLTCLVTALPTVAESGVLLANPVVGLLRRKMNDQVGPNNRWLSIA